MSVLFTRKEPILKNNISSTYCYQVVAVQAVFHVGLIVIRLLICLCHFPEKNPFSNNISSTYCYQVVAVQAVVHVGSTFGEAERAPTQILQICFSDSLPRHLAAALFRASSSQGSVEPRQRVFREALPTG
jgi:hypothetical protein